MLYSEIDNGILTGHPNQQINMIIEKFKGYQAFSLTYVLLCLDGGASLEMGYYKFVSLLLDS